MKTDTDEKSFCYEHIILTNIVIAQHYRKVREYLRPRARGKITSDFAFSAKSLVLQQDLVLITISISLLYVIPLLYLLNKEWMCEC